MNQNGGKCRIRGHQEDAQMICTIEQCDQISRYLCKQCITENLHRHNQQNSDYIMDLKNFCNYILNKIKQYQAHTNIVKNWISLFDQLRKIINDHDDQFKYNHFNQYEYICKIRKNEPLRILKEMDQGFKKISYSYICVKCFNDDAHDHNQIIQDLEQVEKYIQDEHMQILSVEEYFRKIMIKWFQIPEYNQEKIKKIEQIFFCNNCQVDYEQLIQMIFIKNRTYDNERFYKTLLLFMNKLSKFEIEDMQLKDNLKIKYNQENSFDKTWFYKLKRNFPQFIVSSNEQDFILQDKNNNLVVGDLQSQQIKQIQQLSKTIRIMKFSIDSNYFFCSDEEGYILCYKTKNYKQTFQIKLHQREIRAFLPIQNNEILSYSGDGDIKITNFINKKVVIQIFIEDVLFQHNDHQLVYMNDRQNCIEYDEKRHLIFLGDSRIYMRHRKNLLLKEDSNIQELELYQLQLIKNKTYLLSGNPQSLKLWKFNNGLLACALEKQYDDRQSFKFCANDANNRIIVMGKCFFEILDYNFSRINIGNFDCHSRQYSIQGRKFQIEQQNSCYIILISANQIEVSKRVLLLQE